VYVPGVSGAPSTSMKAMTTGWRRFGLGTAPTGRLPFTSHLVTSGRFGRGKALKRKWANAMEFDAGMRSSGGPPTVVLAHV
jgi:hypothetical protein